MAMRTTDDRERDAGPPVILLQPAAPDINLDEMVFIGTLFKKSRSYRMKKMLHPHSLSILVVSEIPLVSRELRASLSRWVSKWQHLQRLSPAFIAVHGMAVNQPEAHASVVTEYMEAGSLDALNQVVGGLPELCLRELCLPLLTALDVLHRECRSLHGGLTTSQVLFDHKANSKLSLGLSTRVALQTESRDTAQVSAASPAEGAGAVGDARRRHRYSKGPTVRNIAEAESEGEKSHRQAGPPNSLHSGGPNADDPGAADSSLQQQLSMSHSPSAPALPMPSEMQTLRLSNLTQTPPMGRLHEVDIFDLGLLLLATAVGGYDVLLHHVSKVLPLKAQIEAERKSRKGGRSLRVEARRQSKGGHPPAPPRRPQNKRPGELSPQSDPQPSTMGTDVSGKRRSYTYGEYGVQYYVAIEAQDEERQEAGEEESIDDESEDEYEIAQRKGRLQIFDEKDGLDEKASTMGILLEEAFAEQPPPPPLPPPLPSTPLPFTPSHQGSVVGFTSLLSDPRMSRDDNSEAPLPTSPPLVSTSEMIDSTPFPPPTCPFPVGAPSDGGGRHVAVPHIDTRPPAALPVTRKGPVQLHPGIPPIKDLLFNRSCSAGFVDFLSLCLCHDSALRPTAAELLQHEWMNAPPEETRGPRLCLSELLAVKTQLSTTPSRGLSRVIPNSTEVYLNCLSQWLAPFWNKPQVHTTKRDDSARRKEILVYDTAITLGMPQQDVREMLEAKIREHLTGAGR
ncbi:unnamed protein product [Vitrella brassicaformis CCMP3155]|uniref:Protein kinase domain-containing protein n=1 Tax=Vitrella brassicaformis (strain CCMP3155) TaxID=1169540 RepID=A0A0G4G475_VITBC|nr:unnamed protein product [Vitrella brassicaformis CCMP3155]|eukprot:CEM23215.1 unnamed protein product [Vitrella brassicaformis CCMP3155]